MLKRRSSRKPDGSLLTHKITTCLNPHILLAQLGGSLPKTHPPSDCRASWRMEVNQSDLVKSTHISPVTKLVGWRGLMPVWSAGGGEDVCFWLKQEDCR